MAVSKKRRQQVLARDDYRCVRCRRRHKKRQDLLQVHHKVPRCMGGTDEEDNLETWCWECHDVVTYWFFREHPELLRPKEKAT